MVRLDLCRVELKISCHDLSKDSRGRVTLLCLLFFVLRPISYFIVSDNWIKIVNLPENLVVLDAGRFLSNHYLREEIAVHTHVVEQRVEWYGTLKYSHELAEVFILWFMVHDLIPDF